MICPGSGRRWFGGTNSPICPVCHRGYRGLLGRDAKRPKVGFGSIPEHERRTA